ncbi:MAG: hypothetical protein HWE30_12685 [Methylocystaceae bacterium]|nr:hypothetical protein [Methylocystaceae bacterium]
MNKYVIDLALKEVAQAHFVDQDNARSLMNSHAEGSLAASRIYRYVMGGQDDTVAKAVRENLSVRRIYRELLAKTSAFYIPEALAASTEEYPERHGEGCLVRLQDSRAQADQVYLIIEVKDQRRDLPKSLTLFGVEDKMVSLDLPAGRNGVVQTIIDRSSLAAVLLADPKTEIFLR